MGRKDLGVKFVSPELVAIPAYIFLGPSYARAVGLPEVTPFELLLGQVRCAGLGCFLFLYFRFYTLLRVFRIEKLVIERFMRKLFTTAVVQVQRTQPKCRFGVIAGGAGADGRCLFMSPKKSRRPANP